MGSTSDYKKWWTEDDVAVVTGEMLENTFVAR